MFETVRMQLSKIGACAGAQKQIVSPISGGWLQIMSSESLIFAAFWSQSKSRLVTGHSKKDFGSNELIYLLHVQASKQDSAQAS